jgi:V8-like Glu-specific endopeptidase
VRRTALLLAVALPLAGAVALTAPAAAAPQDNAGAAAAARAEHARIVDYWTPARVRSAIPADVMRDEAGRRVAAPAKGKPGGGTGSTTVTGASWNGGGAVLATTGKVLFTMGGSNYVCSGSVVADGVAGRALALTAGHCVYDEAANAFATNWMFVPAFDTSPTFTCASTVYGCWTATALLSTTGWANGDFNYDAGFAVLGNGGKSNGPIDDVVGAQQIAFNTAHPTTVHAFGYPADGTYTGNDLVYCAGTDAKDTAAGSTTYSIACTLNGGSSGGPWFRDFNPTTGIGTLTSVNSYTYRTVKNRMYGPYLGSWAQRTYNAATTATSNALIS